MSRAVYTNPRLGVASNPFASASGFGLSLGDLFCLVVPLLQAVQMQAGGNLLAADLAVLVALPIALFRHPERLRQKPVPVILALGCVWLLSQIVTDLIRNSSPDDYVRGWSKIFFFLVNLTMVWLVACRSRRRFILYGTGLAMGSIVSFCLIPSDEALISPWKFALGVPVTLLVVMWTAYSERRSHLAVLLPLSAMAVLHAFQDFRIMAVISFVTAIYVISLRSAARMNTQLGRGRIVGLAFIVVLMVASFGLIYTRYARQGVFGQYAQHKLEAQGSGEAGPLLGGRSEILASVPAIIDSPLLGHGSWARDPVYAAILAEHRAELGYRTYKDLSGGGPRDDLIPTHSYLFGAWVEAGVAGGVFWLFIFAFTVHALLKASGSEPLLPLFAFSGFMFMWDILFSPLGTPTRFVAPYFLVAMVLLRACQWSSRTLSGDA